MIVAFTPSTDELLFMNSVEPCGLYSCAFSDTRPRHLRPISRLHFSRTRGFARLRWSRRVDFLSLSLFLLSSISSFFFSPVVRRRSSLTLSLSGLASQGSEAKGKRQTSLGSGLGEGLPPPNIPLTPSLVFRGSGSCGFFLH